MTGEAEAGDGLMGRVASAFLVVFWASRMNGE
jgi:hypothetical protein